MAGLKINICFWYLDKSIVEEILKILKDGDIDPISSQCKDIKSLSKSLIQSPPDLIISDFDLPDTIRHSAEESLKEIMPDVPMIYLVGEKNEGKAAETLKSGV